MISGGNQAFRALGATNCGCILRLPEYLNTEIPRYGLHRKLFTETMGKRYMPAFRGTLAQGVDTSILEAGSSSNRCSRVLTAPI